MLYKYELFSDRGIPVRASFFEFFSNYKLRFIIFQNEVSIFILESWKYVGEFLEIVWIILNR